MTHDRDYYRSYSVRDLLRLAREDGINPEMAIVLAEQLATTLREVHTLGCYHFNINQTGDQ